MSERFADDPLRDLITQIDNRLREAERLRHDADQQHRDRPFWPERRRHAPQHTEFPDVSAEAS